MEEEKKTPEVKMMLCPHCKEQIIKGAKKCPHCHGKIKSKFRKYVWPVILILIGFGIWHSCNSKAEAGKLQDNLKEIKMLSYSLCNGRIRGDELMSTLVTIEKKSQVSKDLLEKIKNPAAKEGLRHSEPALVDAIDQLQSINASAKRAIQRLEKNDIQGAMLEVNSIHSSIKLKK